MLATRKAFKPDAVWSTNVKKDDPPAGRPAKRKVSSANKRAVH
jgi:hypothetical protein